MTPRSIRRAAERKASKAARKAERLAASETVLSPVARPASASSPEDSFLPAPAPAPAPHPPLTEDLCWRREPTGDSPEEPLLFTPAPLTAAQLAANRLNAQLSTGPSTAEGKAKSSLNAVKTALTGRTVLLPTDDAAEYERHLLAYTNDFHPVGPRESDLVQSIADIAWRLKRIPCLESAVFAQGYLEFGQAFNQHEPSLRAGMIELQTFVKYEKQLRNLQLQEARLARRREKEMAELRQLRLEREQNEREALESAAELYLQAQQSAEPFEPVVNGFVFSIDQIEKHIARVRAKRTVRTAESSILTPSLSATKQAA